jgi:hypothetical protein
MKARLLLITLGALLLQEASAHAACQWDIAKRDVDFTFTDLHALNCASKAMREELKSGWDAIGECNRDRDVANLDACKQRVCGYLRELHRTPACPGDPRIKRRNG